MIPAVLSSYRAGSNTAIAALITLLSACATYTPHPLDTSSPLHAELRDLELQVPQLPGETSSRFIINPDDGLDLTEVGMLAVLNNPDLKSRRKQQSVAGAQIFSAGLLQDPQLSAGVDKPTGDTTGLVDAQSLSLSYDIIPLISRHARIEAAQKAAEKVRLDLLWEEWQVIQQARSLAVRLQFQSRRLELLQNMHQLYLDRYQHSSQALQEGNITLDVNGTDLTALLDILSQISQLEQANNDTRHKLNLLLGLEPGADLPLATLSLSGSIAHDTVDRRLALLPDARPDLVALKAGYASQEAKVRTAILEQFPSLGISINRARDTGGIYTSGLSITLNLPFLSGNRGVIAIERATREQLQEEYRSRLARARVDIERLYNLQGILRKQQDELGTYLPRLESLVNRARRAYNRNEINALTFLNMESTWVNKRLEQLNLTQTEWENRIALQAMLALPDFSALPASISSINTDDKP